MPTRFRPRGRDLQIVRVNWRFAFVVGGLLPIAFAIASIFALPESIKFLLQRPGGEVAVQQILARLSLRDATDANQHYPSSEQKDLDMEGDRHTIFAPEFYVLNAGLWLAFFTNLAAVYALISWTPTMLASLGLSPRTSINGSFYFNLFGIVGALASSWIVARMGSRGGLLLLTGTGALSTLALSFLLSRDPQIGAGLPIVQIFVCICVAGTCLNGGQAALYGLAANAYPTSCRAAGIGWAAGIGRCGAILSAFGGGVVLATPLGPSVLLGAVGVAMLVAGCGTLIASRHYTSVDRN